MIRFDIQNSVDPILKAELERGDVGILTGQDTLRSLEHKTWAAPR